MFRSIINIIFRTFNKHKFFSFINIAGLTFGFAAFIALSLFIYYEFHWDSANEHYDRIYRVQQYINTKGEIWTQVPPAIPGVIKNNFPEVEQSILVREAWGEYLSTDGHNQIYDPDGFYADQDFFSVFTVKFKWGNVRNALTDPNTMVLSETLAQKFFGNTNPMGKTIYVNKVHPLKISGVYKDFPRNAHFTPGYITTASSMENILGWKDLRTTWTSNSFRCYILVKHDVDLKLLNQKIARLYTDFNKSDNPRESKFRPYLHPLSEVYLSPTGKSDYLTAIVMYCVIALLILVLSAINYINHTTAYASIRAKEIAVRKVNGSSRGLLIAQFLSESIVIAIISCIIAICIVSMILPFYNQMVDRHLELNFKGAGTYYSLLFGVTILIGVLSGLYPAFLMSSRKAVQLLKGNVFGSGISKGFIRKGLVTFQFIASIFLIIASIFMNRQIGFSLNKELGFKQDNLYIVGFKTVKDTVSAQSIQSTIAKYPEINGFTVSENVPFAGSDGVITGWEGSQPDEREDVRYNIVDYNFLKTWGIKLTQGRDFSDEMPSDVNKACIINETAMKRFGWKDPIGKYVGDKRWQVIGVVKDFHLYSVHEKIPPMLLEFSNFKNRVSWMTYTFRVQQGKEKEAKQIIENSMASFYPNDPFEVKLFTDIRDADSTMKNYRIIRNTFMLFALINIFLTIFGLFGLVSFTVQRRTKEIGIRKINGSSVWKIFLLLNREYTVLILLATLVSWPLGYLTYTIMPFAYKFSIGGWEYLLATAIVFVISLATISYFTYKAAIRNPIEALRYE